MVSGDCKGREGDGWRWEGVEIGVKNGKGRAGGDHGIGKGTGGGGVEMAEGEGRGGGDCFLPYFLRFKNV